MQYSCQNRRISIIFSPFASLTYPNMSLSQCLYLRKIQLSFFPPFLLCKHPWRHLLIILSWLINLAFYHLTVKWKKHLYVLEVKSTIIDFLKEFLIGSFKPEHQCLFLSFGVRATNPENLLSDSFLSRKLLILKKNWHWLELWICRI